MKALWSTIKAGKAIIVKNKNEKMYWSHWPNISCAYTMGHVCKMWGFCYQTCGQEDCPQITTMIMPDNVEQRCTTGNSWLCRSGIYAKWPKLSVRKLELFWGGLQLRELIRPWCELRCSNTSVQFIPLRIGASHVLFVFIRYQFYALLQWNNHQD